ncbi:MAG: RNA polymerase sigma factor [Planctomycetaceae bacterium]|nr:RNA polymerase sigma factor [Planctomycetaceae bacterium]
MTDRVESTLPLLTRAVAGDPEALEELLWSQFDRLSERIGRKLPVALQGLVSIEDILQPTFVEVWKNITTFEGEDQEALFRWMTTIANNKLIDRIRSEQAVKRGAGRAVAGGGGGGGTSSVVDLVSLLTGGLTTPSGALSRQEAERALVAALDHLKPEYRQAVQLRYLDGLPVAEVADRMNRSEGSVHMLLGRALKKLRNSMGHSSLFLSKR